MERERERELGRRETRVSDSKGMKRLKNKRKREKMRELTIRERRRQKIMLLAAIDKDNIYKKCST